MPVTLRRAGVADARGIAETHVEGWRWGYREILPAEVLDALDVDGREARWAAMLADPEPGAARVVAVDDDDRVVGFTATGRADDGFAAAPPGAGELFALYLRDGWQGRGVGCALLGAARRALGAEGFATAILWVFDANDRARTFYETDGWRPDGAVGVHRFDGGERPVLRYATAIDG